MSPVLLGRLGRRFPVSTPRDVGDQRAGELGVEADGVLNDPFRADPILEPAQLDVDGGPAWAHLGVVTFLRLALEDPKVIGHLGHFCLAADWPVADHDACVGDGEVVSVRAATLNVPVDIGGELPELEIPRGNSTLNHA